MNKKTITSAFDYIALKLKFLVKKKEADRLKLETAVEELKDKAKALALIAEEKENTKRMLEVTAKKLATTAEEKEDVRKRLATTADELKRSRETLEQKVIERTKDLALAKARDKAILTSIGDGLVAVDEMGKILMVNNAFENLVGWKEKEVLGKLLIEVVPREDESHNIVSFNERILTKVLTATATATATATTWYYIRKDKTRFLVASIITPFFLEGKISGAVEVFRDITKEKALVKDLEKFKLAVDNVSDQIIITDSDAIVLYINNAAEKITGYSMDEVVGVKAGKLWGNLMERSFYENLWKTIKIDKKTFVGEIMNQRKNNQKYTALINISPILDEKGEVEFFVGIERDISKEIEIDKAKSEFVSLASHQLRTPLGIIKWFMEALEGEEYIKKAPGVVQEYFKEIYKSNERLLSLVRQLLSVSRIEQGRVKNVPQSIDLLETISDVVKEMKISAQTKKITLNLELKQPKLPSICIDSLLFHEVIENLVANAIEYTPQLGKVDVVIDIYDESIIISVKDTGIGISTEDQKKIFTKFYRAQKAVLANPEGSGLGLYVVKSYVEGWGGKIMVESEEGKGSTFTISLPI